MRRLLALFAAGVTIGVLAAVTFGVPVRLTPALAAPDRAAAQGAQAGRVATTVSQPVPLTPCEPAPLLERAAQVLMVGLPGVSSAQDPLAQEVTAVGVGAVFLNDSNVVSAEQVRDLTFELKAAAIHPLLVGTDEEAGRVSTFRPLIGATSSPRTLATTMEPSQVRDFAADLGADLASLGINLDLAPVADLDDGPSSGVIGDRSFAAQPMTAAKYAMAFSRGLSDAGVIPVVKHFPGHGRAAEDVHKQAASVTTPIEDLLAYDIQPFVTLIDAGAPVVMVGHVEYDALDATLPASLSRMSYRLLRDLGFEGVAITDSLGMGAIHRRWDYPDAAVKALAAGADLVLVTDGRQARAIRDGVADAVRAGTLDEDRLNEAAARVLTLKGVAPEPITCAAVDGPPAQGVADRTPLPTAGG